MRLMPANRWSLAFADLSLLMLGFVILSFVRPEPSSDPIAADPPSIKFEWTASSLFEPREAMLTATGRAKASEVAQVIDADTDHIRLSVKGSSDGSTRLDHWELSAARMAAFGRALKAAGVHQTDIMFGEQGRAADGEPQHLIITITRDPARRVAADGTGLASGTPTHLEE